MLAETLFTTGLAIAALANAREEPLGNLKYAFAAGIAIGAATLACTLWSGGASFDRFASRMALLPSACVAALLAALGAYIGGAQPVYIGLCTASLFASVYIAKVPTAVFKLWLESAGHLTRLIAVVADEPEEREAAISLLQRRSDVEIVFSGPASQTDMLRQLVQEGHLDEVVLAGPSARAIAAGNDAASDRAIATLAKLPVTLVRIAPRDRFELHAFAWFLKTWRPDEPWTVPAAILMRPPAHGWSSVFKRMLDIAGAVGALVLLGPLMLACAIAIKLESRGPVLFVQERAGYGNRSFRMFKFRSMYADCADLTGSALTQRSDPRVTKVGNVLRRTSIDELPQIFNVLLGNMSLVGPRPHPKGAKAGGRLYDELIPDFYSRYRMKPGITGLAQISGLRGNTETEQHLIDRFHADLRYVAEWTPFLDISILLRTVTHLLKATNAF